MGKDYTYPYRRSTRLKDYDYTSAGYYFITICTYGRLHVFENPQLARFAETQWHALQQRFSHIRLDAFVLMPSHIHGIIEIHRSLPLAPAAAPMAVGQGTTVRPGSLGAIIRAYKAAVVRRANKLDDLSVGPVWQRGYWDRIVRDENELNATRRYIDENPLRWAEDRDNLEALLNRMTERS